METIEAYLARKFDELKLLSCFLSNPMSIRPPKSVHEVIERKFHLAAALKAEHTLQDWSLTETAWAYSARPHSGPFEFQYDYQRADLKVRGPSFYRALTDKRVAFILQNCRRTARYFSTRLAGLTNELDFAHGLYVTLAPAEPINEKQARDTTEEMCSDLRKAGLALRHAGSFGFDFAAAEWERDRLRDRYVVRLAVPDLPEPIWGDIAQSLAAWWERHHRWRGASNDGAKI